MSIEEIILFLIVFAINFTIIIKFKELSNIINIFDIPDSNRKLHSIPTALLGGFIFYFSVILISFYFFFNAKIFLINNLLFIFFLTLFFIFGIVDDIKDINANIKFIIILFLLLIYTLLDQNILLSEIRLSFIKTSFYLNNFSIFFTIFCILLYVNAFNMFDGINLQTGIYSSFCFLLLFLFTKQLVYLYLIIPNLFFLYLNYNKKCFLGNSGSSVLSFFISIAMIYHYNEQTIQYADSIFLLMAIPGFELLRLAIVRMINKKHPFTADLNHLHHLLIKKFSLIKTNIIIQSLIIIPNILSLFGFSIIYLITLTLLVYIYLVTSFKFKITKI
jgi:UDP-N-acetylmuramyl pentapeptide phosphotransferase/UDP-N-acetylglucosamine-1-phosphate transferase